MTDQNNVESVYMLKNELRKVKRTQSITFCLLAFILVGGVSLPVEVSEVTRTRGLEVINEKGNVVAQIGSYASFGLESEDDGGVLALLDDKGQPNFLAESRFGSGDIRVTGSVSIASEQGGDKEMAYISTDGISLSLNSKTMVSVGYSKKFDHSHIGLYDSKHETHFSSKQTRQSPDVDPNRSTPKRDPSASQTKKAVDPNVLRPDFIKENLKFGKYLALMGDNSLWQVELGGELESALWLPGTPVVLKFDGSHPEYNYILTADEESVRVKRID